MSATTPTVFLQAVEEQRSKLINVLGAVQCVKLAARSGDGVEFEAAVELIEDEVQRIVTGLEEVELEKAAEPHSKPPTATPTTSARFMMGNGVAARGYPMPLPCPFCGANEDVEFRADGEDVYAAWATCCGGQGPGAESPRAAADAWNRRRTPEEWQHMSDELLRKDPVTP